VVSWKEARLLRVQPVLSRASATTKRETQGQSDSTGAFDVIIGWVRGLSASQPVAHQNIAKVCHLFPSIVATSVVLCSVTFCSACLHMMSKFLAYVAHVSYDTY
jgi:hypothetical protein